MNRRRLLAGLASGSLIGLGGCSNGSSRGGSSTPTDEPDPTDDSTPTESRSVDLSGRGPFDGWSMARGGPRRLGRNGSGPTGEPETAWTAPLSHARHRLAVADGVVFVTQEGVATTALDPADGTRLAEDVTGEDGPETEPVVVDGRLYYGTLDGALAAREAESAAESWRVELPRVPDDHGGEMPIELRSTPAVADERVYVRGPSPEDSAETATFCFGTAASGGGTACDGWPRTHDLDALADPVTDGDLLVVQSQDRLLALDVGSDEDGANGDEGDANEDREPTWQQSIPGPDDLSPVEPTPALGPDRLYVRTHAGLQTRRREDGTLLWTRETDGVFGGLGDRLYRSYPPAVSGGVVYAGFVDGRFEALDAASGELVWAVEPEPDTVFWTAPAVDDDHVYVGAHGPQGNASRPEGVDRDDARFYAIDRSTGESVASVDGDGLLSDPAVGSDGVYVSFGNEVTGFR